MFIPCALIELRISLEPCLKYVRSVIRIMPCVGNHVVPTSDPLPGWFSRRLRVPGPLRQLHAPMIRFQHFSRNVLKNLYVPVKQLPKVLGSVCTYYVLCILVELIANNL